MGEAWQEGRRRRKVWVSAGGLGEVDLKAFVEELVIEPRLVGCEELQSPGRMVGVRTRRHRTPLLCIGGVLGVNAQDESRVGAVAQCKRREDAIAMRNVAA